jgi:hypothetical protein
MKPTNPGQTNPGQTKPGQTNPGQDKPWTRQTLDMTNRGQYRIGGTLGNLHRDFVKQWICVHIFADFSSVLLTYSKTYFLKVLSEQPEAAARAAFS